MDWLKINEEGDIEFVSDEIKLVPEMKSLLTLEYNKGKGDNEGRKKLRVKTELKYLYLVYSPKSPYKDYTEAERVLEAKLDCLLPQEWVESKELKLLVPKFKRGAESKVMRMLSTVERFIDKFDEHLNNINLNERTESGLIVHKPKEIMETLERLPRFAESLQELEQQAKSGVIVKTSSKGDHEVGWMATTNSKVKKKQTGEQDEPAGE